MSAPAPSTASLPPAFTQTRVLVVDDEPDILDPMARLLRARGFEVATAPDGAGLRRRLAHDPAYDIVLLDVMLPGEDGLTLCRRLSEQAGPPVILLTALGEPADRVRGLETGADDYVVKPFDPAELMARIRTVLRRVGRASAPQTAARCWRFGRWCYAAASNELTDADGHTVVLGPAEDRLLQAFLVHTGATLSRERLLELCAGPDAEVFDRSIDTQVSRLRRKLEADPARPRVLRTVWGQGYRFDGAIEVFA